MLTVLFQPLRLSQAVLQAQYFKQTKPALHGHLIFQAIVLFR